MPTMLRYGRLTLRRFVARLQDPSCRQVFANLVHFGGPDVPMLTVLLPLAYAHRRMTGIPRHGWLAFGRAVERRFLELGGEIRYGAKVARLRTSGGAVNGVELAEARSSPPAASSPPQTAGSRTPSCSGSSDDARFDPRRVSDQPVQVNLGVAEDWSSSAR